MPSARDLPIHAKGILPVLPWRGPCDERIQNFICSWCVQANFRCGFSPLTRPVVSIMEYPFRSLSLSVRVFRRNGKGRNGTHSCNGRSPSAAGRRLRRIHVRRNGNNAAGHLRKRNGRSHGHRRRGPPKQYGAPKPGPGGLPSREEKSARKSRPPAKLVSLGIPDARLGPGVPVQKQPPGVSWI